MNTAADIFSYAQTHDINLNAEDGQLKIDAPETALTDEFLESAKQHKSEILEALTKEDRIDPKLMERISEACTDIDMTPEQFIRVLSKKGEQQIINGELSDSTLKEYAKQIDDAINDGVVSLIMDRVNLL